MSKLSSSTSPASHTPVRDLREKCLEWARRTLGLPTVNVAKSPLAGLLTDKITSPVAKQLVAALPDDELNTLYTAAITELLSRQRAQGGGNVSNG